MSKNEFAQRERAEVYLGDMLVTALSHSPDRPTIILDDGTIFSARAVAETISVYMTALAQCGLRHGDRAGVLSGNRIEVLHFTNACMLAGIVVVALPPMGSLDDQLFMVRDAALDALFFDEAAFDARAAALAAQFPLRMMLTLGASAHCPGAIDLLALTAMITPTPLRPGRLNGDDILRLAYSGGTTGRPKAIIIDHRMMTTCLNIQLAAWDWPVETRQLICAPLSHSGAACFVPTVLRGGALVVLPRFDPVLVMAAIERHRITCVLLVPTMIYAILDHPRFGEFNLASLEVVHYGASAISPARLREAIERIGPVFCQFYGQSEAPMTVTVLRRAEHLTDRPDRLRSCGRPVAQLHFALLDDAGDPVPDGTPGEICVAGPLVMPGYWGQPEQTKAALRDGWLHSGDVGVRDGDGFITLVDRKKDMIISGGFNVYPREIEDVLTSHPAVAGSAVFGLPDDHWGEVVTAIVVRREGILCDAEELIALVRERKGSVQAPKRIDFVAAIPLTAVGKPDKTAIRASYAAVNCVSADDRPSGR